MKLHEFKRKHMYSLAIYEPASDKEKNLRDMLMVKLNNLRMMTLPNFIFTLYQIIEHEDISEPFRKILKEILEETELITEDD